METMTFVDYVRKAKDAGVKHFSVFELQLELKNLLVNKPDDPIHSFIIGKDGVRISSYDGAKISYDIVV